MNRYVIIYEIKSKNSHQVVEENSAIHVSTPVKFSLAQVKKLLLETHGFTVKEHYIRILNVCNLGSTLSPGSYKNQSWSVFDD